MVRARETCIYESIEFLMDGLIRLLLRDGPECKFYLRFSGYRELTIAYLEISNACSAFRRYVLSQSYSASDLLTGTRCFSYYIRLLRFFSR